MASAEVVVNCPDRMMHFSLPSVFSKRLLALLARSKASLTRPAARRQWRCFDAVGLADLLLMLQKSGETAYSTWPGFKKSYTTKNSNSSRKMYIYIYTYSMPYQLFCQISDPSTQNVFCAHENQCAFGGPATEDSSYLDEFAKWITNLNGSPEAFFNGLFRFL